MPLYTQKSLSLSNRRGILSPQVCQDDGQEDLANSEHSGRWIAGMHTLRWCITLGDYAFPTTGTLNVDFTTALADNWEFQVFDAIIESRIAATGGTYRINLGDGYVGLRNNMIIGPWHTAFPSPVVYTDEVNASLYDANMAGKGGKTADNIPLGIHWEGSSLTGVVPTSRIVVVVVGYLVPEPYVAGS